MPRSVGIIIQSVTENAFGRTYLFSPLSILPLLYSVSSLLDFSLHENPSSLSLCANVTDSSKDNSVVLHTSSSSASTVQTGGRGGCCLESFGSALSAVNHSWLLYERGKRSVQCRSPGRTNAIRWKREGEVGKKRKKGGGKTEREEEQEEKAERGNGLKCIC